METLEQTKPIYNNNNICLKPNSVLHDWRHQAEWMQYV